MIFEKKRMKEDKVYQIIQFFSYLVTVKIQINCARRIRPWYIRTDEC